VRFRTAAAGQLGHYSEADEGKTHADIHQRGAVRLNPSLRVRLHGRNRLPELALTLSLVTMALLSGAALFTPASGNQDPFLSDMDQAQMIEMRSAAIRDVSMPVRKDVRVIPLDASAGHNIVSSN
jgi:hypothetical protein